MKYQFQSNPGEFSYKPRLFTNAIKVLISINFVIFILQTLSRSESLFFPLFGLVPKLVWSEKMIWQPVTYLFFHGGIWHVLINMFVLWMFGSELERLWGKNHFLKFYFITGVGSGLATMLVNVQSITPVVGASGAVYGVLLAYGLTYPNRTVYLYGIIPIKSLWFVLGIGFIAFMSSFDNMSQVSHVTHLSGMLIGYFMIKKPIKLKGLWFQLRKKTLEYQIQREEKELSKNFIVEQDINQILDKINQEGFDSLTEEEQERLYKGSQSLSKGRKKD
jgi:membrane associated rhomboid family serine protease